MKLTEQEWRQKLTHEEYRVCREKGTERPFTGLLLDEKGNGDYNCKCCGHKLFDSNDKFDSGCGWPSFAKPISTLKELEDRKLMRKRTEVRSSQADSHLGHVFEDGPAELGGLRYCINGVALNFEPEDGAE